MKLILMMGYWMMYLKIYLVLTKSHHLQTTKSHQKTGSHLQGTTRGLLNQIENPKKMKIQGKTKTKENVQHVQAFITVLWEEAMPMEPSLQWP